MMLQMQKNPVETLLIKFNFLLSFTDSNSNMFFIQIYEFQYILS